MVKVPNTVQAEGDQESTSEEDAGSSGSAEEIKTEITTEMQLAAQSIVFSFLQNKHNKDRMKSRLVPAISVTLQNYQIMCYDSEQDILVSTVADSEGTELFDDTTKSLKYTSVLVLWMALNYRLLCSGVPKHSEKIRLPDVKAEFFERVGDHLYLYKEAVERPALVSCRKSSDPPSGQGKSMEQIFGQTWKHAEMAFEPLF